MKNSKIFTLTLLLFFVFVTSGLSLAQNVPDPEAEKGTCSWTAGKTPVSDLSPEQKKKLFGLKLPPGYWERREKAEKLKVPKGATFPTRFDWRDSNGVTPAKDQAQCGSCWDFCAVGALEAMVKIYGEVELDLSEQQVLSCKTYGYGCDGAWPELAYELFQNPGAAKEECMRYQADHWVPCTQSSCEKWAKISHWTAVCDAPNVDAIKNAIYNYGPVATLMAVPDTFFSYTGGCFDYIYFGLNHCVLLVGWDDTLCDGEGAWIGKNSWSWGWGMDGFFYIKRGVCQIGTGTDLIHYIFHRPYVRFEGFGLNDDSPGGNGDKRAEPGEAVRLDFALKNLWSPLGGVEVTVSADTEGIVITDDYTYLGDMDSKAILDNSLDPMEFYLPDDFPVRRIYFTFHVTGDSGGGVTYTADTTVEINVGRDILLVDDDQGVDSLFNNYEKYYIKAFDSLKAVYDILNKRANPDSTCNFSDFDVLIWFTGDHRDSIFSHTDIESLMTFLDNGGRLFLPSQDAVEALFGSADPLFQEFLTDYLHVGYDGNNTNLLVYGHLGDEIEDSLWIYPGGPDSPDNQTSKDNLVPDSQADTILLYATYGWAPTGLVAGTKFQNDLFKVMVFGFGFEGINSSGSQYYGRYVIKPHVVMQRVLDWLKTRPTINVSYPNGGDVCFAQDTCDILWESVSFEDSVIIEYSIDGGTTWETIVDTTTNDGSYSWVVPDTTSDSCLVKISDVGNGIPSDISDDYFYIIKYVPGDVNADLVVDVGDAVFLISYLYRDGDPPVPLAAGDVNGDCVVNLGDIVYLIAYLYRDGPPPLPGCA